MRILIQMMSFRDEEYDQDDEWKLMTAVMKMIR